MRKTLPFLLAAAACAHVEAPQSGDSDLLKTTSLAVTDQSLTDFTAEARLELNNPSDTEMRVVSASWELSLDEKTVASGTADIDKPAAPGNTLSFRIPGSAEIVKTEEQLKELVSHTDAPLPLVMKGTVKVTQGDKTAEIPFSRAGELRAPRLPVPKMNDAALGKADEDVTVSFYLGLDNQNPFRVKLKSINYKAEVDGKEVGSGVASMGEDLTPSQNSQFSVQEGVPNFDKTKTEIPYHFTGTADLGLIQVPIDLTGTIKFSAKAAKPAKKKKSN